MIKGQKCTKETKIKMSKTKKRLFKEGKLKIWNSDLTKETDKRIKMYGLKVSKIKKGKFPQWLDYDKSGKNHPLWNKKHKLKSIEKMKQKRIEYYKTHKNYLKGKTYEEVFGKEKAKKIINKQLKNRRSYMGKNNPFYNKKHKKETIEKTLPKILKKLKVRPTSIEKKFIEIIKKYNLPFDYCGDGALLIGFKNPDFVESNGRKICLEVANRFHHKPPYEINRISHFSKYGWRCLVIFEEELDDERHLLKDINNHLNFEN